MRIVNHYVTQTENTKGFLPDAKVGSTVYVIATNKQYVWRGRNEGWKDTATE